MGKGYSTEEIREQRTGRSQARVRALTARRLEKNGGLAK